MRFRYALGSIALVMGGAAGAIAFYGCSSDDTVDGFTQDEWTTLKSMSPVPDVAPPDTTNKYADDPKAAALGQMFFFDKTFGGPIIVGADQPGNANIGANGNVGDYGKISCINCHNPAHFMIDERSNPNTTALGTQWMIRNAGTSLNADWYKVWCEKDGVREVGWADALTDPEDPTSMDSTRARVAHVIYAKYKDEYNAVFQPPLDPALDITSPNAGRFPMMASPVNTNGPSMNPDWGNAWMAMAPADQQIVMTIFANFGKAIHAYVRLHRSANSPFDRYVAGDYSAISDTAKNGLHLFLEKAGCVQCHSGPIMSDSKFHNTGMAASGIHINPDETGRYAAIPALLADEFNSNSSFSDDKNSGRLDGLSATKVDPATIGQWRTTQLRNVGQTAPYMHTGQLATLKDVVHFYNVAGTADAGPACPESPPPAMNPAHAPCYYGKIDQLITTLNLTDSEENDLVDFLNTLTGDPLPTNLGTDTSKPGTFPLYLPEGGTEGGATDGGTGG
jgi:cytochrome c peroxidase